MRSSPLLSLATVLLPTLAAAPASQGSIVVLDDAPGPGVDATDIEVALALAADGDTILVRDGAYIPASGFGKQQIVARDLAIVADAGANPVFHFGIDVRDGAAGDVVTLRGIELRYLNAGAALEVWDCDGLVWIEDCTLRGTTALGGHLRIVDSADVAVLRSTLGPETLPGGGDLSSGAGITVLGGSVHLHGCDVRGTDGSGSGDGIEPGAPAIYLNEGFLFAAGCTLTGGAGAEGQSIIPFGCVDPTDGGAAVELGLLQPRAVLLDNSLVGGAAGALGCGANPAQQGPPVSAATGTVTALPGTARAFHVSSPVRSGQSTTVQIDGLPSDLVGVFAATAPTALHMPVFNGTLLIDPTAVVALVTVLGPTGSATLAVPDPIVPPVGGHVRTSLQAFFVGTHVIGFLGGASELTTLDPSL